MGLKFSYRQEIHEIWDKNPDASRLKKLGLAVIATVLTVGLNHENQSWRYVPLAAPVESTWRNPHLTESEIHELLDSSTTYTEEIDYDTKFKAIEEHYNES